MEGFTLGVDDILVQDGANLRRKEVMKATAKIGDKCAAKGNGFLEKNFHFYADCHSGRGILFSPCPQKTGMV